MQTEKWSPWGGADVLHGGKDFLLHIAGNGCKCKGWVDEYVWEPAGCALAAWDAAAFCDVSVPETLNHEPLALHPKS